MGVGMDGCEPITKFEQWYDRREENPRNGTLEYRSITQEASRLRSLGETWRSEMQARCATFPKLERLAAAEVAREQPDLANVSSGEIAGIVRRIARNVVQHTPNVTVLSKFEDTDTKGLLASHILKEKIIGSDAYSNDMQQNLFSSAMTSLTVGFDCVIPVLMQDNSGSWYVKYDEIKYNDVYPDPAAKDIRESNEVFVRRWLSRSDVKMLIRNQPAGWDTAALRTLLLANPSTRDPHSMSHIDRRRRAAPTGYEILTWYSNTGDPFLTYHAQSGMLLRIEKNKHPLKSHPVHFLILERDPQQPLGMSQVELVYGRQEFQDLMLNGAMKLWYRNINPSIVVYGSVNSVPNLGPGKYTTISNPNAKVEAFEVNTQTLMQYGTISQQNLGSMVNLVGSADQQLAASAGGGMSQTPQGVNAQQEVVDITTNNYQKAIESFFSHYCSYALTLYFHELSSVQSITPSADAREKLLGAGVKPEAFESDGSLKVNFKEMATEYYVKCVPGSLVELEEEKQMRVLNQLFVSLSQAMPAIAQTQDQDMLQNSAAAFQFILRKEIELSGSSHSEELSEILHKGITGERTELTQRTDLLEQSINDLGMGADEERDATVSVVAQLQEQVSMLVQTQQMILQALGAQNPASGSQEPQVEPAETTDVV